LLELSKRIGDRSAQFLGYGNLGYSFGAYLQQYDSAIHYLKLGLDYFNPEDFEIETLPPFYEAISENYQKLGKADSALVYYQKFYTLHDSIRQLHFDKNVQEIEGKYQNEQKEKQIAEAKLEVAHQANLKRISIGIGLAVVAFIFGIFQYFRNQQKRKQYQTELSLKIEQSKAQQMAELNQLKSNFFANISHEFRTPLTLILGPIEQIKNNELKGDIHKYVPMMYRNAHRLRDLTNQLLDLSKIESGKTQLLLQDGDIFQFSRQLISSFESWAESKDLDYEFEIPHKSLWVQYDRDKYEMIISNLISNAIKYTPIEGSIQISLKSEQIDNLVKVIGKIKDNGFGIAKADQEFIFQRFYQSNTSEDGSASSGIGLALTKELVELHGGSITFSSVENEGTQFNFVIPFKISNKKVNSNIEAMTIKPKPFFLEDHSKSKEDKKFDPQSYKNKSIVLIVEDNTDVRNYIVEQIKDKHQILEAKDGKEGLAMAIESIPDLIITDLMMPNMNGNELTRQLKTDERTSHIPVIILTAKADLEDKLEGLETGADDYLTKPFNARELELRVKNAINQTKLLSAKIMDSGIQLSPKGVSVNSVDQKFLSRLLEFLEIEIDNEQLSVEGLAQMIGMSRSQLHRKLTALTNKTPNAFIRTFRMQRAHELLSKKAGNISEIAFMVGFNSLTYFSKCFKDEYGYNPTKVLKKS
jgi:signal transduction histidine kinase/DNA-binding response OmpR family regulator